METMLLSDIAEAVNSTVDIQADISEICTDTRQISNGCLFIAIKGEKFDGHDFIPYAVEKGAVAVVTEKQVDNYSCIVVENTRKAFLEIAAHYRKKFNIIIAGVTGSVGKTTTKEMISLVLSEKYKTLKTDGNLNNEIGLPKTLLRLDKTYQAAVIEMGMSDFGEIEHLSKTAMPTLSVITNIGFSHIENLKTQEGILKAKLEILSGMDENSPVFVNADDELLYPLKKNLSRPVYTYGIDNNDADFFASDIKETDDDTEFTINYGRKKACLLLPCIGRHNILNALAAFSIGFHSGIGEDDIVNALKKYKPNALRQNIVKKGEQTVIIDCYNASPDSMKASLSVLSQIKTDGRRVAVLGDMLELGEMSYLLHKRVGEMVFEAGTDELFAYGSAAEHIADTASKLGVEAYHTIDKSDLISKLKTFLKPGDTILFKASRGMKLEEVIDGLYSID